MVLKHRHKTWWNGDTRHKDGLNTNSDLAYSLTHKTMVFEIQTRDIRIPPKKPLCQSRTYKIIMPNETRLTWLYKNIKVISNNWSIEDEEMIVAVNATYAIV